MQVASDIAARISGGRSPAWSRPKAWAEEHRDLLHHRAVWHRDPPRARPDRQHLRPRDVRRVVDVLTSEPGARSARAALAHGLHAGLAFPCPLQHPGRRPDLWPGRLQQGIRAEPAPAGKIPGIAAPAGVLG